MSDTVGIEKGWVDDPTYWSIVPGEGEDEAPPVPFQKIRAYVAELVESGSDTDFMMESGCGCLFYRYVKDEGLVGDYRDVSVNTQGVARGVAESGLRNIARLPDPLAGVVRMAALAWTDNRAVSAVDMLAVLDEVQDGRLSAAAERLKELMMDDEDDWDDWDDWDDEDEDENYD